MDIFAHGLWAGAVYKGIGQKKSVSVKWAVFWGIFPDLFAFTIPFALIIIGLISGNFEAKNFPKPDEIEPGQADGITSIFPYTRVLYSVSHSLFIFLIIFILSSLIFRRPILELGGWLLHILIDIPTHSYKFFPTPFLWPISSLKFDGYSWSHPIFMIMNYGALAILYLVIFWKGKNRRDRKSGISP